MFQGFMLELDLSWILQTQYIPSNEPTWRAHLLAFKGNMPERVCIYAKQNIVFFPHFIFYLGSELRTLTRLEKPDLKYLRKWRLCLTEEEISAANSFSGLAIQILPFQLPCLSLSLSHLAETWEPAFSAGAVLSLQRCETVGVLLVVTVPAI